MDALLEITKLTQTAEIFVSPHSEMACIAIQVYWR